jgi:predicted nucleic acid-binding protein
MKVFCDTNVLVAAFLTNHPQHNAARPVLERIKARTDEGWAATHSLAESYAVLTRLPGASQVAPSVTWQLISENIIRNFSLISLSAKEYSKTLEDAATSGIQGGRIYDSLLLAAAVKSGVDRIYTFNMTHFQSMADVELQKRIVAP